MSEHTETITFEGASGTTLVGRLHSTPGRPQAYALFAHCFTCGKDLKAAIRLSTALAREGIATLRFDFTGLGESEGDFADTNFSSNVEDLVAAAEMMRSKLAAPRVLIGHSLGGAAALLAAHAVPEVQAVATVGAPCDPAHVQKLLAPAVPELEARGEAEVVLAGRKFRIKRQLIEDLQRQQAQDSLAKLGRALLVLHSPQDSIVDIDNARQIFQAARHPKSFVTLDGADHLLSRKQDADYAGLIIAAWAGRYVDGRTQEERETEQGVVEVLGGSKGLQQLVHAGPHWLVGDEPESIPGGTDAGPTPYDFLLAALGTCTSMTLRMYAEHKGWPLDAVTVRLSHTHAHATDREDGGSGGGRIDHIERRIAIQGDSLSGEQRQRLLQIAERCPVHRTLTSETRIVTDFFEE